MTQHPERATMPDMVSSALSTGLTNPADALGKRPVNPALI